jgi:hypothetical protein
MRKTSRDNSAPASKQWCSGAQWPCDSRSRALRSRHTALLQYQTVGDHLRLQSDSNARIFVSLHHKKTTASTNLFDTHRFDASRFQRRRLPPRGHTRKDVNRRGGMKALLREGNDKRGEMCWSLRAEGGNGLAEDDKHKHQASRQQRAHPKMSQFFHRHHPSLPCALSIAKQRRYVFLCLPDTTDCAGRCIDLTSASSRGSSDKAWMGSGFWVWVSAAYVIAGISESRMFGGLTRDPVGGVWWVHSSGGIVLALSARDIPVTIGLGLGGSRSDRARLGVNSDAE